MSDVEGAFGEIKDRYYPGSRQKIPDRSQPARERSVAPESTAWDAEPTHFIVDGHEQEFFTIGALAAALERSSVTLRRWERLGYLPIARYRAPAKKKAKARRLYTRAQIIGIVKIADEEGLFTATKVDNIANTNFTVRVVELFRRLEGR